MFDSIKIQSCFNELVGFRASQSSSDNILNTSLQTSQSGLFVNALPGITFPVINETLELWQGDINTYLQKVREDEILALINLFVNGLKQKEINKELLTNQPLFSGVVDRSNVVAKSGRFVGFLIKPIESNNLRTEFKELALQISGSQTVRIFLYDTSQIAPIAYYDFNYASTGSEIWKAVDDFIIDYQNYLQSAGQTFLLGYYENIGNAVWELTRDTYYIDFLNCDCERIKKVWQRYCHCRPIAIPTAELNWNGSNYDCPNTLNLEDYITETTNGLNAKVNVTCDITQCLCHNKMIFSEALQKMMACRILNDVLGTSRFNSIAEVKQNEVKKYYDQYKGDLEGRYFGVGDKVVYNKGILALLEIDFSNIDNHCLKQVPGLSIGHAIRSSEYSSDSPILM